MSILMGSNFLVGTTLPLDAKSIVADDTARDALVAGQRYIGLVTYVLATGLSWQLRGGITNSDWQPYAGGGSSSFTFTPIDFSMTPYTVLSTDDVLLVDTSGGPIELDLPTVVGVTKPLLITKISSDSNLITLVPNGAETILRETSQNFSIQDTAVQLWPDQVSNWFIN